MFSFDPYFTALTESIDGNESITLSPPDAWIVSMAMRIVGLLWDDVLMEMQNGQGWEELRRLMEDLREANFCAMAADSELLSLMQAHKKSQIERPAQ